MTDKSKSNNQNQVNNLEQRFNIDIDLEENLPKTDLSTNIIQNRRISKSSRGKALSIILSRYSALSYRNVPVLRDETTNESPASTLSSNNQQQQHVHEQLPEHHDKEFNKLLSLPERRLKKSREQKHLKSFNEATDGNYELNEYLFLNKPRDEPVAEQKDIKSFNEATDENYELNQYLFFNKPRDEPVAEQKDIKSFNEATDGNYELNEYLFLNKPRDEPVAEQKDIKSFNEATDGNYELNQYLFLNKPRDEPVAEQKDIKSFNEATDGNYELNQYLFFNKTRDEPVAEQKDIKSFTEATDGNYELNQYLFLNKPRDEPVAEQKDIKSSTEATNRNYELNEYLFLNKPRDEPVAEQNQQQQLKEKFTGEQLMINSKPRRICVARKHLSRSQIEFEIGSMIKNILAMVNDNSSETLFIADGYCHLDILFDKLNRANQTIFDYIEHNYQLYSYGIDIEYIIQSYFTPYHIAPENWIKYSAYLKHDIVYGICGIHPMFSHQYDLLVEFNLRKALSNGRIVGVGEIGLDYTSHGHPSPHLQKEAFLKQLELAKEINLPVIIISRNSFIETLDSLLKVLNSEYLINWRNFEYGQIELDMLKSRFSNVYFGCSPYHLTNINLQKMIKKVDIKRILTESVAPHLQVPECPNIWETHPLFVASVYKLLAKVFYIPLRQVAAELVDNMKQFYHLK